MSDSPEDRQFELPKFLLAKTFEAPDPNGDPTPLPRPWEEMDKLATRASYALMAFAGGTGLFLFSLLMTPCVGATRSARLQRQQRDQDVAQEITQFEAEQRSSLERQPDNATSTPNAAP